MESPLQRYESELRSENILYDPVQKEAVLQFESLYHQLLDNRKSDSWLSRWTGGQSHLQGLYLFGGTGRGKTYLMDCFYECLPFEEKSRVHFFRFMRTIHQKLESLPKTPNPLDIIGTELSNQFDILCLDEFHVFDIADAMILGGLLKSFYQHGVIVVFTSNTPPQELYKNGLQRDLFLPAIDLIVNNAIEINLGQGTDYRADKLKSYKNYHVDLGDEKQFMTTCLENLAPCKIKHNRQMVINDREIAYIGLADDVVWFDFDELCNQPRSSDDYIEIANCFTIVLISNVNQMSDEQNDVVKRFIHLIDAFYDHHVKLVISAKTRPVELYRGVNLAFEFERTVSRLNEMGGSDYFYSDHVPL